MAAGLSAHSGKGTFLRRPFLAAGQWSRVLSRFDLASAATLCSTRYVGSWQNRRVIESGRLEEHLRARSLGKGARSDQHGPDLVVPGNRTLRSSPARDRGSGCDEAGLLPKSHLEFRSFPPQGSIQHTSGCEGYNKIIFIAFCADGSLKNTVKAVKH